MQANDRNLVEKWRGGSKRAFAEVVEKYQTLVCSIAYANTGNLSVSEELAQEAFLIAWRSINDLRDADRLKQWLCGIVRNLAKNSIRKRQRDVLRDADTIEQTHVVDKSVQDPSEQSIAREEAELLDRTMQSLPETYREPLVLFYREGQSVARVSELLELSPDAVKQRLTRGRKLLHAEVTAVVERGLLTSAPSVAFTAGVLAAVSSLASTAKAAAATATAAKGAGSMQGSGLFGAANGAASGLFGAFTGMLLGVLGAWYGYKTTLKSARSPRERTQHQRYGLFMLIVFVLFAVPVLVAVTVYPNIEESPRVLAVIISVVTLLAIPIAIGAGAYNQRRIEAIRKEDGTIDQPIELTEFPAWVRRFQTLRKYESKARFLGIPLVSIHFNPQPTNDNPRGIAFGWIAMGDLAYGVLFAFGSVAVGGIAVGAGAVGLLSIGGFTFGVISFGGAGVGVWALGGVALGWIAFGGLAIAWKAAVGGVALAREIAVGGPSLAIHANDEIAKEFVEQNRFFQLGEIFFGPWTPWVGIAMVVVFVYVFQRIGSQQTDVD